MVEYDRLISDGTAYIDMPIKVKAGWSYTFNIKLSQPLSGNLSDKGLFINGANAELVVSSNWGYVDGAPRRWINAWTTIDGVALGNVDNIRQVKFATEGISINEVLLYSTNSDIVDEDREDNLRIFNGTKASMQIRSIEISNADGVMVHNFKPYKIGEAVCLYDIVSGLITFNSASSGQLSVENDE